MFYKITVASILEAILGVGGGRRGVQQHLLSSWLFHTVVKNNLRASLLVQWLRICLAMQGTQVQSLVWEDPTCS